ncbi:hypothetical protein [Streptomyces sp. NPDC008121]
MTSFTPTPTDASTVLTAAADATAAPAWLHIAVMAVAAFVLVYSLARHNS